MSYYFVNVSPKEEVKVGARVRVDVAGYKNFVGTITEIKDGIAYIQVPTHYNPNGTYFMETTERADNLYKFI